MSGPAKYLTDKEEESLAMLLSCCGVIGYVRSKAEVLSLVQHILESRGKHVSVSHGWWASFQQHHPELVLRNPAPLSQAIRKPQILKKHWLLTNSKVNLAKFLTWMSPGSHWMQRCLSLFMQGSYASAVTSGNKAQVTVVACVSAAGFSLPSMVIWDWKNLAPELAVGEVPGTIYGLPSKG